MSTYPSALSLDFASSGFSVSRTEITSVMQPMFSEYYTSDGTETNLILKREPDTTLEDVQLIRVYYDDVTNIPLDNITGDTTYANEGEFYYDPDDTYVSPGGTPAPHGRIVLKTAPTAGTRIRVDYFLNPDEYAEYENGVLRNLAKDLTLHPYANNFSVDWSNIQQKSATLTISTGLSGATGTAVLEDADGNVVDFVAGDVNKRIRQANGAGIATITAVNAGTADILVDVAWEDYSTGIYSSGDWLLIIESDKVEPQPYNLVYPFDSVTGEMIAVDINGQQNHTKVFDAIKRIGNLFIVESEKGTDILSSVRDINSATSAIPTSMILPQPIREKRKPQKWRIRFLYDERDDYLHVNVGTKFQIMDNGDLSRGMGRDGIKGSVFRLPGELSEVYFSRANQSGKSKAGFFRRQGKTASDTYNTYPITYRLTCSDHGTGLFIYDQAAVDQDDDYAWFVVQRHVNNSSGKIELEDGKSPVHCIYSPSKRPVEASEVNMNFYGVFNQTYNTTTEQTTQTVGDLTDIYDVSGRKLAPGEETRFKFITDKLQIPAGSYGIGVNYNNGVGPQTSLTDSIPSSSGGGTGVVTDWQTPDGPKDQAGNFTAFTGLSLDTTTNYGKAREDKIGPSMLGLLIEELRFYPNVDATTGDPLGYVPLVEGTDWNLVQDGVDTNGDPAFKIQFVNESLTQGGETGSNGATGSPKLGIIYRWNGAGYLGIYKNPYGRQGDGSSSVFEVNRMQVYVSGAEIPHAISPNEYSLTSDGDVNFPFQNDYQGTSINSYVYSISKDAVYLRNELAQGTVLDLEYQNYAYDPDANNLYLVRVPQDPDLPDVWNDIHKEGKGIYRFVVRESDVLKPWDQHVSAVIPQVDSPAIINPLEQLSITQDKTFVFNFPTPMASQRYIYPNAECDLICYSGADSSTEGGITNVGTTTSPKYDLDGEQDSSVDGVTTAGTSTLNGDPLDFRAEYPWHTGTDSASTSANRTYIGMQSTKPFGNGMRIFLHVRGGSIRPEYSDYQVRS